MFGGLGYRRHGAYSFEQLPQSRSCQVLGNTGMAAGGGGEMSSLLLLDLRHLRVYPGRCAGSLQDGLLSLQ
jgi:hypothetical protein